MLDHSGLGILRPVLTALVVGAVLLAFASKGTGWLEPPAQGGGERVTVDTPPAADDVLSQIVTAIARRPARAQCDFDDAGGTRGYVRFVAGKPEDVAHLGKRVCSDLGYLQRGLSVEEAACVQRNDGVCGGAVTQVIHAVHVISHESYHVAGVQDEAAADCYALQAFGWVARKLGTPREFSRSLLRYYWKHYAPIRMPPGEYWSDQCRSGGELDLRDDDVEPPWAA